MLWSLNVLILLTLAISFTSTQINAEQEIPLIMAKNSHSFLETASDNTKHEYLKLEENRKMAKVQIQYLKDELIKNESPEVQKLYDKQKRFEAERLKQIHESHLFLLGEYSNPILKDFIVQAHEVHTDNTLSLDQMCDKLILLRAKLAPTYNDIMLVPYGCGPYFNGFF